MAEKLEAGAAMPEMDLPLAGGGTVHIGGPREGYQVVIVYRGKHCPVCKKYLGPLTSLLGDFKNVNAKVVAVSADPQDKAEADVERGGWKFPVAYDMTPDQMRALGLYISHPRSDAETDRDFPEPALFVVNPKGEAQVIDISNAPWVRPDLTRIAAGIAYIQKNDYPIRGTAG